MSPSGELFCDSSISCFQASLILSRHHYTVIDASDIKTRGPLTENESPVDVSSRNYLVSLR